MIYFLCSEFRCGFFSDLHLIYVSIENFCSFLIGLQRSAIYLNGAIYFLFFCKNFISPSFTTCLAWKKRIKITLALFSLVSDTRTNPYDMTCFRVRLVFILLLCVLIGQFSLAQTRNNTPIYRKAPALGDFKMSIGTGVSYYLGDMRAKTDLRFIQPHLAIALSYRLAARFSVKGEIDFYRISGKQEGGPIYYNNLSFRSDNPAGYIALQIDAFKYNTHRLINPYLFGGIGITRITPKAKLDGTWYSLPPLMTEGIAYNRNVRISVIGLGASWKYSERWSFGVELSDNFANSDYLDDVSTSYPNPTGMSELALKLSDRRPELDPTTLPTGFPTQNQEGNQRGNPSIKDSYGFLSFRAEYLISTKAKRTERRKLKCYY